MSTATARNGKKYSSYTAKGELRSEGEIAALAGEVFPQLSSAEVAAMLTVRGGAVPVNVDWRVEIGLRDFGLIGYNRSGDNAYPLTPLGRAVFERCSAGVAAQ